MKAKSITITRQLQRIDRIDGNRSVSIYTKEREGKIWMSISREQLMAIMSRDMMIDITFSPIKEALFDTGNICTMVSGPKTITERWKDGSGRTIYEYHINSGIFTIEGVIVSDKKLPFIGQQYYLVLVTKHKEETK